VDLNNLFVAYNDAWQWSAPSRRLASNVCAWIKGLLLVALEGTEAIVGYHRRRLLDTHSLIERPGRTAGSTSSPFGFPYERTSAALTARLPCWEQRFGGTRALTEALMQRLDVIRANWGARPPHLAGGAV
jgi:hypothetical protein